jgi:hypothetical protein
MNEHHYQRIDKGQPKVKRLKISEVENEARKQARTSKGTFLPVFTPEIRSIAILEAIEGIKHGWPLPKQVAEKHGIPQSTLYSWLIVEPRAIEARALFFGERLGVHLKKIEEAADPLELARAREAYRAWADLASKRDPANYGMKQEITHSIKPEFNVVLKQDITPVIEGHAELVPEEKKD